jgi:integrase
VGAVRINGKRRTVSDKNDKVCAQKLFKLRQEVGQADPAADSDETVAEFLDDWLRRQWDYVDTGQYEWKTVDDFDASVKKAKEVLGDVKLKNLHAQVIYNGLERLAKSGRIVKTYEPGPRGQRKVTITRAPLSRRTVKKVYNVLTVSLDEAVTFGKVPRNEARLLNPRRLPATVPPTKKRALSEGQFAIMREAAERDLLVEAFLLTGFANGLRSGENMGASWDRVNWKYYTDEDGEVYGALDIAETLKVKGGNSRDGEWVPEYLEIGDVKGRVEASRRVMLLDPEVLAVLRRWRAKQKEERLKAGERWQGNPGNLIFTSQVGTPMSPRNMARRVANVLKGTELEGWAIGELTRHSFSTLVEGDLPPQVLERAQGHAPGSNARRHYIHREKTVVSEHLKPMKRILKGTD